MKKQILISLALAGSLVSSLGIAANFTTEQKKQVEQIVHDYLVDNPQVLVEASQALQRKQQSEMEKLQAQAVATIREQADAVFFNKQDPVIGNPKGAITVVEFFDYQCGHCREMTPVLEYALKHDKQLRVVFKMFPIFGGASELAAKAALAAGLQAKFYPMHQLLMQTTDYSQANIMTLAKQVGLDVEKFKTDLQGDTVKATLAANVDLAKQLKLYFTPVLVATNTQAKSKEAPIIFVPGGLDKKMLQALVDELSQK